MYGIAPILLLLASLVSRQEALPTSTDCPTVFCGGKSDDDYPNPPGYDPTHFITCSNELTYCRDCPANLKFNGVTKRCGNYTHIPDDPNCPSDKFCVEMIDGNYANPKEYPQNYYVDCMNGFVCCMKCNEGFVFNGELGICTKGAVATPTLVAPSASATPQASSTELLAPSSSATPRASSTKLLAPSSSATPRASSTKLLAASSSATPRASSTPRPTPSSTRLVESSTRVDIATVGGVTVAVDPPEKCPSSFCVDKADGNYPNPSSPDQRTYVSCSGQVTYCMDCNANLVYDGDLGLCLPPTNSTTPPATSPEEATPTLSEVTATARLNLITFVSDVISFPDETAPPTEPSPTPPGECPLNFCLSQPDGNYPNPASQDQRIYISCSGQVTYCMECNANLAYNAGSGLCLPPTNNTSPPPTTEPDVTTPADEPTPSAGTPPSDNCPSSFCSTKLDGNYANPASPDQRTYISCSGQVTYCMDCSANLVYNAELGVCVEPSTDGEQTTPANEPTPTDSTPPQQKCPQGFCLGKPDGDYPSPISTTHHTYISCSGQVTYCRDCPASLVYNAEAKLCLPSTGDPSSTHSHSTTSTPPACPADYCSGKPDGDYPNPVSWNRAQYISCSGQVTYCRLCPGDLFYDPDTKNCQPSVVKHPCTTYYPDGSIASVTTKTTTISTVTTTTTTYLPMACSLNQPYPIHETFSNRWL